MMPNADRYPDLLGTEPDPELMEVVSGLDTMRRSTSAATLPPERDQAIKAAIGAWTRPPAPGTGRRLAPRATEDFQRRLGPYRMRLASLTTAALLVLAGIAGYLRFEAPTPASAAKVLHRAATAMSTPAAGDVVHETTTYTTHVLAPQGKEAPSGSTDVIATEQWSRFTPDGSIDRFSLSIVYNGTLQEREVLNQRGHWFYNPKSDMVVLDPPVNMRFETPPDGVLWPKQIMMQPQNLAVIHALLLNVARSPDTQLLPQQRLDGRTVDVVQITHHESTTNVTPGTKSLAAFPEREVFTIYIDATTHMVRRMDQQDIATDGTTLDSSTLLLTTVETLAASEVPPHVFDFTPPPGVPVQTCSGEIGSCSPGKSPAQK